MKPFVAGNKNGMFIAPFPTSGYTGGHLLDIPVAKVGTCDLILAKGNISRSDVSLPRQVTYWILSLSALRSYVCVAASQCG